MINVGTKEEYIILRISSVLSMVEPDLYSGSDQKVPAPAPPHCTWSPCFESLKKNLMRIRILNSFWLFGSYLSNFEDPLYLR